jgi:hypothetical protein
VKEAAMRTLLNATAAGAASLALVACGGGSDYSSPGQGPGTDPTSTTAVPGSAIASSADLVVYLSAQSASDETSESLTLPASDPFTSETEEPRSL